MLEVITVTRLPLSSRASAPTVVPMSRSTDSPSMTIAAARLAMARFALAASSATSS